MEHGSGMGMLDVLYIVGDVGTEISGIAEGSETGTDEGSEVEAPTHLGTGLHIDLVEDLRHHALTLVVVHGHVFVILLLANVMADDLAVDDGAHAVSEFLLLIALFLLLAFVMDVVGCRSLLNPNVADFHIPSVLALAVPALAVVHRLQVTAVGIALLGVKGRCMVLLRQWVSRELNLIVGNHTALQLCFYLRL